MWWLSSWENWWCRCSDSHMAPCSKCSPNISGTDHMCDRGFCLSWKLRGSNANQCVTNPLCSCLCVCVCFLCMCALLTGCSDAERTAALLNRQQHKPVHMATPGAGPLQRSSHAVPHRQRSHHSDHQPLPSPALHWNPGPPETHTAETHGSSLLETDGQKDRQKERGVIRRGHGQTSCLAD